MKTYLLIAAFLLSYLFPGSSIIAGEDHCKKDWKDDRKEESKGSKEEMIKRREQEISKIRQSASNLENEAKSKTAPEAEVLLELSKLQKQKMEVMGQGIKAMKAGDEKGKQDAMHKCAELQQQLMQAWSRLKSLEKGGDKKHAEKSQERQEVIKAVENHEEKSVAGNQPEQASGDKSKDKNSLESKEDMEKWVLGTSDKDKK
jgi:hypothetical protein